MIPLIIAAVLPVTAGSLMVGGDAFTECKASSGKEEAPVSRVHGGSFKIQAPLSSQLDLTLKGKTKMLVVTEESQNELGIILSYGLGDWKLLLGDDYIWRLNRLEPKKDSLSQILSASVLGTINGGIQLALSGEKIWDKFYWTPNKDGTKSEIKLVSSWKPTKSIFLKAEIVRNTGNYEEEPWRDYTQTSAGVKVKVPLGDGITGTVEGTVLNKEFPNGTRYSDYSKKSVTSQLKWVINKDLTFVLSGDFVEKIALQSPSSDYRTRAFTAEMNRKFGNTITMKLKTRFLWKDFFNVEWGSSDYSQRLFGMEIKNKLLSDLTFSLNLKYQDKLYLKKDSLWEDETSIGVGLEKAFSKSTSLDTSLERLKKNVSIDLDGPNFDTILKAKLTHDLSKDIKASLSCSYSTANEKERGIKAEVKYSFK